MKMIKNIFGWSALLLSSALLAASCSNDEGSYDIMEESDGVLFRSVSVDLAVKHQTIDSFSASDCWMGNPLGQYWSESQKEEVTDWLFSTEMDGDGNPAGIGLSMWRFNLGAGSYEQGEESLITAKSHRSECFLNADGTYDWSKHEGQRYLMQRANELGCEKFVLFSNSPPVHFTKNGLGWRDSSLSGRYTNLKADCYDDYAAYIGEVLEHFRDEIGIEFSYISPINEPQYTWASDTETGWASQEGTSWRNDEVATLVKEIDSQINSRDLDTKILIGEAASYEYVYSSNSNNTGLVADAFFNSANSSTYIGDCTSLAPLIAAHGYWTDGSWSELVSSRTGLKNEMAKYDGIGVYQTEWSMLGDGYDADNIYPGHSAATYTEMALYMSKVIHHDLTIAGVTSWSYWTAFGVEEWGHKCRFYLIKITPNDSSSNPDIEMGGSASTAKTLWVLGNYSRFIRPGYSRVDLSMENQSEYFFGSAYLSPEEDELVIVCTNLSSAMICPEITLESLNGRKVVSSTRYVTNVSSNLTRVDDTSDILRVEGESCVTFVVKLE